MTQNLLLGIDLEDVRDQIPDGYRYRDRVEKNVDLLLDFLEEQGAHATFFTVGSLSRRLPAMVRRIHEQGHEVAAHGNTHTQLTKLTPETFSQDLSENLDCLTSVTGSGVCGFRAPTFSLVESSQWAYEILANQGIKYSSSVLAARNPLYGWPGFGTRPRLMAPGVLEIPISLHKPPLPGVPLGGGVYLRVLPFFLTRWSLRRHGTEMPITTYLHPYDIDVAQERFMHPDLNGSAFMNALMYRNRNKALPRLAALMRGRTIWRYCDWAEQSSEG